MTERYLAPHEVEALASDLMQKRTPHVLATVVWVRPPSSARPGQKAILGPDGFVAGWVGGSCAQPIVIREASQCLRDGVSRLVTIGREGEFPDLGHGQVLDRMTCGSQGSIQVFLEVRMPRTRLVVVGDAPVSEMLLTMGQGLGYDTVAVLKDGGTSPSAARTVDTLDTSAWPVDESTYVVVATRNRYDRDAAAAALAAGPAYVAVVCSQRRADGLLRYLEKSGFSDEQRARVHAPAGLDLGSIEEREIAVAILAEVVRLKAQAADAEPARPLTTVATDSDG